MLFTFVNVSSIVYAANTDPTHIAKEYFKYLHESKLEKAAEFHSQNEVEYCQKLLIPKIMELEKKGDKAIYFGMRYFGNNEVPIEKALKLSTTQLFGYALYSASLYVVSVDDIPRVIGHTIEGNRAFVVFEQILKLNEDNSKNKKDFFVLVLKKSGDTWKVTLDEAIDDFCTSVVKTIEINSTGKKWTIN